MKLADEFGVGIVSVDNAFHYLWGGGYVIDAAQKGYIAYTCCTSALAEVVPFGGKFPTLGRIRIRGRSDDESDWISHCH